MIKPKLLLLPHSATFELIVIATMIFINNKIENDCLPQITNMIRIHLSSIHYDDHFIPQFNSLCTMYITRNNNTFSKRKT